MQGALETPAVLVDLDRVDANIERMASVMRERGVALRPHAKTHKSVAVARRQLAAGAVGLTVATIGEAEVFAANGITTCSSPTRSSRSGPRLTRLRAWRGVSAVRRRGFDRGREALADALHGARRGVGS